MNGLWIELHCMRNVLVAAGVYQILSMQYQLYASVGYCLIIRLSYISDENCHAMLKSVVYCAFDLP
jgi:hypothetical protein